MQNILKKSWLPSKRNPKSRLLTAQSETAHTVLRHLMAAQSVLVGTHEHPDGDALGSTLALIHALRALGKNAEGFIPDEAPEFFSFLPGLKELTTAKPDVSSFDLVVVLDYTQLYRTHMEEEVAVHPNTICIDHHYDNLKQTKINLIVPEAAATAQIMYELFTEAGFEITPDIATCLLTGIFTDTGSFMHDSVTPDILDIASDLMNKGARLSHIAHETYQRKDLSGLKIWGRALSRIFTDEGTGAAVSLITLEDLQECDATLDDLSGVVNMLNTLPDTTYAMLLVEYEPGKIKGSLRSEPHKGVDVSKIAKRLGGGGHKLASGFEVDGHFEERDGVWRILPARTITL